MQFALYHFVRCTNPFVLGNIQERGGQRSAVLLAKDGREMTLALAWKCDGRIHLASDSRIKFGENKYADVGLKVLTVPVRVTGTALGDDGGVKTLFEQVYGMVYAGSFVNAGTFCELIGELLRHVQYIDAGERPLSFELICSMLVGYCSHISTEVCKYMEKNGRYVFVFSGYCPHEKQLRAALFEFEHADGQAKANFKLVLKDEGEYVALGSGKEKFDDLHPAVQTQAMIHALDALIESRTVESVGGDIQYGSFHNDRNFGLSGLIRKTVECVQHNGVTYGPSEQRIFRYRGFQIYDGWRFDEMPLWITPNLLEIEFPPSKESTDYFRTKCGLPVD